MDVIILCYLGLFFFFLARIDLYECANIELKRALVFCFFGMSLKGRV